MSRQDRWSWFSARSSQQRSKRQGRLTSASRALGRGFGLGRRLHVEPLEDRRMLAVITVDSLADDMVVDGSITLREAIQAANTDASVDGSVAGSGADTINFDAALSGQTITLGGTELEITEALTIDATSLAAGLTIDADELSRIFNITATTGDFTLAGLTITSGRTTGDNTSLDTTFNGGAIRSLTTDSLTIDQSTISGNSTTGIRAYGGGIFSSGAVTLTSSTVSGNSTTGLRARGGGVFSGGDVTLTNSTISGNSTLGERALGGGIASLDVVTLTNSTINDNSTIGLYAGGGGIYSPSTVTLTSSTVSGNSTAGRAADGGGIKSSYSAVTLTSSTVSGNSTTGDLSDGGGIYSRTFSTLTSSTISGNSTAGYVAEGGGIYSRGGLAIAGSTITDNHANHVDVFGGGIAVTHFIPVATTISITNSIVAGNTAGGGSPDIDPGEVSTFAIDFSLLGTAVTPDAGGTGNLFNDTPFLGALADNGGPTETHALLVSSPAINAGDPSFTAPPDFDQRGTGFPRVNFDRLDIGAFEFQATFPVQGLVVDTATDLVDGDFTVGNLSLREAIAWANIDPLANLVTFDTSLSGQTITLGGAELQITEALTIDATALAENVTIDADELSRIFNISATSGDFTLAGLTLTGGRTTGDNVFPAKTFSGGAVRSLTTGSLTIDQSTIVGNSTMGSLAGGSGIFSTSAVILTNSSVTGNSTTGTFARGGGIYSDATVLLTNSAVSDNFTSGDFADGGGIFSLGDVTLTNSTLGRNSTSGSLADGGGVFSGGAVTLTSSTVSGNSTSGDNSSGGGVFSYGVVTLASSTVTDNHANYANATGGGIWNNDDTITITHSIVSGNTAGGGSPDIDPGTGTLDIDFSLLGTAVTPDAGGTGNLFDDTPLLGVLADNGGPTQTHALLAGSPAIDAGDPAIVAPPANDQRGTLFLRQNGTIDIGAFEIQPQSLVVDTLVDENDGDYSNGDLSLREAIDIANAVPVTESITFAAALDGGTIDLQQALGELAITDALTIDASSLATGITIDAGDGTDNTFATGDGIRIFNIDDSTFIEIVVQLSNLTLTGGDVSPTNETQTHGGAIISTENLTISNSTISGNSASGSGGGIDTDGPTTFIFSTFNGNSSGGVGGAVFTRSSVFTIDSSTISENSAGGAGGGLAISSSNTTITSSTINNNVSGTVGGGIAVNGSVITIAASTITGNLADFSGGGIRAQPGTTMTITSSTITGNRADSDSNGSGTGGGVRVNLGNVTLSHVLVAGNDLGDSTADDVSGSVGVSSDFNLIGVDTGLGGISDGTAGNQIGSSGAPIDPLLGPLADNGGPTETHRLLFGSPAIDAGDPAIVAPPAFDQRGVGFPRLHGTIDIGAFEGQGLLLVVDTLVDEKDGDISAGNLSLREAIDIVNGVSGADTIIFDASLDGGTIDLLQTLGELTITDDVSIDASSLAAGLTLDAGDGTDDVFNTNDGIRVFNINDGSGTDIPVQLVNLTLTGGDLPDSGGTGGGAIDSQEDLTLTSVTIVGNSGFAGGGIRARFGTLTLFSSTISGNTADRGGGIYASGETTIINQSTISDNSTGGSSSPGAGGIRSNSGPLTITSSTISDNMAMGNGGNGGGISLFTSPLILTTSTVSGNSAGRDGGGIVASNSDVTITSSTISGNTANIDGGGIVISKLLTITSSTITGNRADNDNSGSGVGGGIVKKGALDSLLLSHTLIAGNDLGNGSQDDISSSILVDATSDFNLIGVDTGFTGISDGVAGNQVGTSGVPIDPLLGLLTNNGGPTETHALLAGSPAIDTGDSGFTTPPDFDQRGAPFVRVIGGRIDIGAVEDQPVANSADFDIDGDIDGTDFLAWQRGFGTPNANSPDGDADNDNDVDAADLVIWSSQFGQPALVAAVTAPLASEPVAAANLIDAVMAIALVLDAQVAVTPAFDDEPAFSETFTGHAFTAEAIVLTAIADESEPLELRSSDISAVEAPWLADELLERVFG